MRIRFELIGDLDKSVLALDFAAKVIRLTIALHVGVDVRCWRSPVLLEQWYCEAGLVLAGRVVAVDSAVAADEDFVQVGLDPGGRVVVYVPERDLVLCCAWCLGEESEDYVLE